MDAEISPADLADLRARDADVRVVDVRSPAAFDRGHIPGSVNVPFDELPSRVPELVDAERVVTVCPHGEASVQAARLIASHADADGTRVESMAGGLAAWEGPLESTDADADADADAPF